jgi:Lon protease-like protein
MTEREFTLPLFPLGVFLLPGEKTGLHIFEPRYRQLIQELEVALAEGKEEDNRFGIPFHYEEVTASTGTLVRLVGVKKVHPGGRKDVVIECVGHFDTTRFHSAMDCKPYPGGSVVERRMELSEPLSSGQRRRVEEIKSMLDDKEIDTHSMAGNTLVDLTKWLGLPPAHKHRLLTTRGDARKAFLDSVLRWTLIVLQQETNIKDGFFPN